MLLKQDLFGENIHLFYDGKHELTSLVGGISTILLSFIVLGALVYQCKLIINFELYDITDSTIIYDFDHLPEIDFSDQMKDFAFGFLHKMQPVDMIDNEYLKIDV